MAFNIKGKAPGLRERLKQAMLARRSHDPAAQKRLRCRKKFLRFFPRGFQDSKYIDWERGYKWRAHEVWQKDLGRPEYERLLEAGRYAEIAKRAVNLESRTNLLFSFEKMALRDAVKSPAGAKNFALGLYDYVYGTAPLKERFEHFVITVAGLPRRQTRVLTWPLTTVFGFLANPKEHIFVKPRVTQKAAEKWAWPFAYRPRPNWETYKNMLDFAAAVRSDIRDLRPRDLIDIQSYLWVQGSEEY